MMFYFHASFILILNSILRKLKLLYFCYILLVFFRNYFFIFIFLLHLNDIFNNIVIFLIFLIKLMNLVIFHCELIHSVAFNALVWLSIFHWNCLLWIESTQYHCLILLLLAFFWWITFHSLSICSVLLLRNHV